MKTHVSPTGTGFFGQDPMLPLIASPPFFLQFLTSIVFSYKQLSMYHSMTYIQ